MMFICKFLFKNIVKTPNTPPHRRFIDITGYIRTTTISHQTSDISPNYLEGILQHSDDVAKIRNDLILVIKAVVHLLRQIIDEVVELFHRFIAEFLIEVVL